MESEDNLGFSNYNDVEDVEESGFEARMNESLTFSSEEEEVLYGPASLDDATSILKWAFWIHVYGFACIFFFLAFYAFFSILNLRSQLSTRPYMTTINSFLFLLGATRSAVLFIDPYGLQKRLPPVLSHLLWDVGYPSLVSSFSLIQIAFLQLTQLMPGYRLCRLSPNDPIFVVSQWQRKPLLNMGESGGESFRKKTFLSLVISLHFMSVIISAIYSSLNADLMLGKMVTQLLFAVWGLVLCSSFLISDKRVLCILLGKSSEEGGSVPNEKGIANLFGMGMMGVGSGPGQNLASSLTAALAPTLLQSGSTTLTTSTGTNAVSGIKESGTPKIKVTDENERTLSLASESSRLNDIPELPETNGKEILQQPLSPGASTSPRPSFSGPSGEGDQGKVRPPSPVLPRRKSSGPGLGIRQPNAPRRLSWNRRDSTELAVSTTPTEKDPRKKSLTWGEDAERRRSSRGATGGTQPEPSTSEGNTLLSTAVGTDYTLQSILSHIAYVNQTALDYRLSRKLSRSNQAQRVVKLTAYTALMGFVLSIVEVIRLVSPFGILADVTQPSVWAWFAIHTVARLMEFVMGATIANISKQPVNRPHHYAFSIRHKHPRDSLYHL